MKSVRRVPGWYVRNDNALYRKLYENCALDIVQQNPPLSELRLALSWTLAHDMRGGKTEAVTDAIMARFSLAPIVGSDGKVWATSDGWRERT